MVSSLCHLVLHFPPNGAFFSNPSCYLRSYQTWDIVLSSLSNSHFLKAESHFGWIHLKACLFVCLSFKQYQYKGMKVHGNSKLWTHSITCWWIWHILIPEADERLVCLLTSVSFLLNEMGGNQVYTEQMFILTGSPVTLCIYVKYRDVCLAWGGICTLQKRPLMNGCKSYTFICFMFF